MKTKTLKISQILCIVLAAALLLTVVLLIGAKSEVSDLEKEVQALNEQVQSLHAQLNSHSVSVVPGTDNVEEDGDYSTFIIDYWAANDGMLTVSSSVYVGMFSDELSGARVELWRGDAVVQSIPLALAEGEAEDVYEAVLTDVTFTIPQIDSTEELQLWLVVESANGNPVFTCGAGWYLEGDELMLVSG